MKIYHYLLRYSFENFKGSEVGHGLEPYDSITPLYESPVGVFKQLEQAIAYERKHDKVSITYYDLLSVEYLSTKE